MLKLAALSWMIPCSSMACPQTLPPTATQLLAGADG